MKKINVLLVGAALATLFACSNKTSTNDTKTEELEQKEAVPTTSIEFAEKRHDFGKITEGEKVSHIYKFKNTGQNELILSSVKASCGCTVPSWPKEPIAPGTEGEIEVVFNSSRRKGIQRKSITVIANTDPQTTVLTFSAEILPNDAEKQ